MVTLTASGMTGAVEDLCEWAELTVGERYLVV